MFSAGFVCPEGATLPALDNDPDRLRRPTVRGGGRRREVDWPEAFAADPARVDPLSGNAVPVQVLPCG
ncbi:hypothetical protein [Nocardiopsis sp. CNT312]|uniref:hypothetical protein n=1 Tax=Nocardiopsis sp. CNT312 TaxID=1137268 RepID=UPI00048B4417|nr:hypothetical protein [Nocardiopsis sp. CNT312]